MGNNFQYAINVPNFGDYSDPLILAELASKAEKAGWDGFFIWDHISGPNEWKVPVGKKLVPIALAPYADPWVALAAIAAKTSTIRIGALVTPIARRRPWKLARETVSLDHLSKGRLIVGVGLGGTEIEFKAFGESSSQKVRAEKLDEGLDVLTGLWKGKIFSFSGKHFKIDRACFLPRPFQRPRIPIWVACFWPNKRPLQRAARFDGVVPAPADWSRRLTPEDVREIKDYIQEYRRGPRTFDLQVGGQTPGDHQKAASIVQPYIEAGATWWSEEINSWRGSFTEMKRRISQGPPVF